VSVTAGDNAKVTQKNTQVKFSVPLLGPLLSAASAHPVIASVAAVAVIGGGGVATTAALSGSASPAPTALVRGFAMKNSAQGAPTGYDFSHTPPVVADNTSDAIYRPSCRKPRPSGRG
jgi:hypothetical protein